MAGWMVGENKCHGPSYFLDRQLDDMNILQCSMLKDYSNISSDPGNLSLVIEKDIK